MEVLDLLASPQVKSQRANIFRLDFRSYDMPDTLFPRSLASLSPQSDLRRPHPRQRVHVMPVGPEVVTRRQWRRRPRLSQRNGSKRPLALGCWTSLKWDQLEMERERGRPEPYVASLPQSAANQRQRRLRGQQSFEPKSFSTQRRKGNECGDYRLRS